MVPGYNSYPAHQHCKEVPLIPASQSLAPLSPSLAGPKRPGKVQPKDTVLTNFDGRSDPRLQMDGLESGLHYSPPRGVVGMLFHMLHLIDIECRAP